MADTESDYVYHVIQGLYRETVDLHGPVITYDKPSTSCLWCVYGDYIALVMCYI
jgi:hypothetical protein